ncbi:MAG: HNH endonuclease, partial [Pyrinomonadaceae bacterium]
MADKAGVLTRIAALLATDENEAASALARQEYPWVPSTRSPRRYGPNQATKVFLRDGFKDRYSGQRLVFPGALLLLSRLLPREFPAHPNWKMDASHVVYWELWPTIDHLVPVARGGEDEEQN